MIILYQELALVLMFANIVLVEFAAESKKSQILLMTP